MHNLLTLASYLQSWDEAQSRLRVRVLVVPFGNPLQDLGDGQAPPFADTPLSFRVLLDDDTDRLPELSTFNSILSPDEFVVSISSPPGDRRPLFEEVEAEYRSETGNETFDDSETTLPPETPTGQLKAYLPNSYRTSFAFTEPRSPLVVTDDEYKCLMRCPPTDTADEPPKEGLSWNEMMGFLLQRPKLAEVAGLIHEIEVPVPEGGRFYAQGGWLAVTLDGPQQYTALDPRLFATRVPVLEPGRSRPIFTPVLFPVATPSNPVDGTFGSIFDEAVRFDDGFASVVHARQPISSDLLDEAEDEDRGTRQLIKDEGVQLGWDNEDVVNGQNRSIGVPVEEDGSPLGEAPRGIIGYRVDVRPKGDTEADWISLSLVEDDLGYQNTPHGTTPVREERWTGVYPNEVDGQLWLPMYFERWTGRSLVWKSAEEQELRGVAVKDEKGTTGDPGQPVWPSMSPLGSPPDLQYGTDYDFRVRLADTTGGGPASGDVPFRPAEAPIASVDFRRFIPMERVQIDGTEPDRDRTTTQAAVLSKDQTDLIPRLQILRPGLGYPAAVYTRYLDARADLEAHAKDIREGRSTDTRPEIPDPDAKYLQVRVLVRMPSFDPAGDGENGYTEVYRTYRPFDIPADNANVTLPLSFTYTQANQLDDLDLSKQPKTPEEADSMTNAAVVIPTARDVQVELAAVGPDPNGEYFGSEEARIGDVLTINVHAIEDGTTVAGRTLLTDMSDSEHVQTFYVRDVPDPDTIVSESITSSTGTSAATLGRFAAAAELITHENMIAGPVGERVVFGCAGLKHHRAPDGSSLELSDPSEIAGQFVSVVRATLDRDWSWMGDATPFVTVKRSIETDEGDPVENERRIGTIDLLHAVNTQAVRGTPDRSRTQLLFLDAFRPPVNADGRPEELRITYTLELAMEDGRVPNESVEVTNEVPIVSPPVQQVTIVGAGYALSPYGHTRDYSATQPRSRRLWIEIDKPLDDDRYVLFGRVVRHAPDPMLLPTFDAEADAVHVARSPLPEEHVRMFVPGQPRDTAGFTTMQRLEPVVGKGGRHFSLPLPENMKPTSPHLFDFFTYELAVGYDRTPPDSGPDAPLTWVTAQARFGPPMTVEGIQHPPPPLPCEVFEEETEDTSGQTVRMLRAQSTFATPYSGQRRLVVDTGMDRNTQVWFVLYARLMQADSTTMRNVPIDLQQARRVFPGNPTPDESAETTWERSAIQKRMENVGVPLDAPLSVMAVELLPEPNGNFLEPLRGNLGDVRILRSSTLVEVELTCCV